MMSTHMARTTLADERTLSSLIDEYPHDNTPTLEESLFAIGFPRIDQQAFLRHKETSLQNHRRGTSKYLSPIGIIVDRMAVAIPLFILCLASVYAIGFGIHFLSFTSLFFGILGLGLGSFLFYCGHYYSARWEVTPAERHECSLSSKLFNRVRAAEELEGVCVCVERLADDPLLVAVRDTERYYIGAYNTGDEYLDNC